MLPIQRKRDGCVKKDPVITGKKLFSLEERKLLIKHLNRHFHSNWHLLSNRCCYMILSHLFIFHSLFSAFCLFGHPFFQKWSLG